MNTTEPAENFFYDESVGSFRVRLTNECRLLVSYKLGDWTEFGWFKDVASGKAWFPKRRNFMSLIKQCEREGDWDSIKKTAPAKQ